MTTDEKYKLSVYKDISLLSEDDGKRIYIVKNEVTDRLFIKKIFHNMDNLDFYKRLATLKHENLTAIHDVIKGDCEIYIIEDYINGQTLKALSEHSGEMSEKEAIDYILQICDALIYLHSQNPPIIHRDIKPENIICSNDNIIKLVDFDIAREFKETSNRDTVFMGTKEYAAPEQYGYKQTDCRTDIFSVGVLLHELLTGRLPENNITYNGALRKIIEKCIEIDPVKRFQSVLALKRAIEGARVARFRKKAVFMSVAVIVSCFAIVCLLVFLRYKGASDDYVPSNTPSEASEPADIKPITPEPMEKETEAIEPVATAPVNTEPIDTEPTDTTEQADTEHEATVPPDIVQIETEPQGTVPVATGPKVDLFDYFIKIESGEEKPSILLEDKAINETIRKITGGFYNDVANTFQEYYVHSSYSAYYNPDSGYLYMSVCNMDGGYIHDRLLFETDSEFMSITYYDKDVDTTYYFTTEADKGLLTPDAFNWVKAYPFLYESPVVFSQAPSSKEEIKGVYYIGNSKKIEIFEEGGEIRFSYTDIRKSRDAEPLIAETIHKIDESHYWIKNVTSGNKNRLIFNFSKNHLTLFTELYDEMIYLDGIYSKG